MNLEFGEFLITNSNGELFIRGSIALEELWKSNVYYAVVLLRIMIQGCRSILTRGIIQ
jgi:hypothetical protein